MKRQFGHEKVLSAFVKAVGDIPQVILVLCEPGDNGVDITTILDAEPSDDAPRVRVYTAELEALRASPEALINFRLFNARELTAPLQGVIGVDVKPVYERAAVRRAS